VIDVLGTALGLAPFAGEAIRALVGKNAHRNLIALVEADLRGSHRVPGTQREIVAQAWAGQRVDPDLGGRLVVWLATGREEHLLAAMAIWRALLDNRLGRSDVDVDALVEVTAQIVRGHLADAQASDRDALRAVGGDIKDHVTRELSALSDAWPAAAGRVRFNVPTVTASFTGHDEELERLQRALRAQEGVVITQSIGGLGGIGKSQLAAAYVRAHVEEYEIVAWVGAEDGAIAQLAQLAARLGVGAAGLAPSDRAQLALAHLAECEQRWLLVLDNVTSAEQLAGLLPGSGNGRVLVTSRDRALRQFGDVLTLDVFDEDTATRYLIDGAQRPADAAAARLVAQALGCLPLALAHAAAYCAAGTSFAAYLQLLEGLPAPELFDAHPGRPTRRRSRRRGRHPCRPPPIKLRSPLTSSRSPPTWRPTRSPGGLFGVLADGDGAGAHNRLNSALNALSRFNLASVTDTTVGVHRLLQKVVRDDAAQRGEHSGALRGLQALRAAFPGDPAQPQLWPVSEGLIAHVFALAEHVRDPGTADDAAALVGLLNRACHYLIWAGRGRRALDASTSVLVYADRLLAAEHPARLVTLNRLAFASKAAGHIEDAAAMFEDLVVIVERAQGVEHPATLSTRNDLAGAYQDAGRAGDAIAIYEQLLPNRERVQGAPRHAQYPPQPRRRLPGCGACG
jgi:tetratricopeptide (TPR) repeat protein